MRFKHLFLFGIILLLAACQKETPVETIPETTKQSNFQAKTVSAEEIPKVMDFLRSELESNSTRSLKGYELNLPFDESRIIEERINQIDDSESGITTYTFAVEKINDEAWVNNLLITENPDGSFQQISLIVFPFPDWFNIEYNLGNAKLEDFKGQILNYSLYDAIDDSKGIYNLEPCGTFDYGDPIGGNEDDYDCLTCTATGGISWSNVDVGSDDVTCHWESEWVEVQDFSGNTVSIFIVHFEVCVTTGEFFTGFDHCPDPNPVGPNDPNIDVDLTYEEIREITANKIISNTGITDPIFELTLLGDDELRSSLYSVIQSNSPEHVKAQEAYDIWIPYLIGKTAEYDIAIALLKRARDDNNHPDYINKSDFDLACSAAWSVLGDDLDLVSLLIWQMLQFIHSKEMRLMPQFH